MAGSQCELVSSVVKFKVEHGGVAARFAPYAREIISVR